MSASSAAGRFFRTYERHCIKAGPDTLFEVLNAIHSLNDRLKGSVGRDLHQIEEFIALKALRNFAHHQEEVQANVKVVPSPAYSDLMVLCIVRREQVERSIEVTDERWRQTTQAACQRKFHWYGIAVNINPCLFNFAVRAYEMMREASVIIPAEDIAAFASSYDFEAVRGYTHLVNGQLNMHSADAAAVLSAIVADLPLPR